MGSDQKRALIAVVISGIFLFGWQKIYSPVQEKKIAREVVNSNPENLEQIDPTKAKQLNSRDITLLEQNNLKVSEFNLIKDGSFGRISVNNSLSINDFESPKALFNFGDVVGKSFGTSFFVEMNGVKKRLILTKNLRTYI